MDKVGGFLPSLDPLLHSECQINVFGPRVIWHFQLRYSYSPCHRRRRYPSHKRRSKYEHNSAHEESSVTSDAHYRDQAITYLIYAGQTECPESSEGDWVRFSHSHEVITLIGSQRSFNLALTITLLYVIVIIVRFIWNSSLLTLNSIVLCTF